MTTTTEPQLVTIEQNTAEWMAMRRRYRTASETPVVMGLSPWKTAEQLAAEKFNGHKPPPGNVATSHGHNHEAAARQALELKLGKTFKPRVMTNGLYLASLDGFSEDGEVCEIKCPYSGRDGGTWKRAEWGEIEQHYQAQLQHQLMVSRAPVTHFWVWDAASQSGLLVTEPPRPEWWDVIQQWWDWFYRTYDTAGH